MPMLVFTVGRRRLVGPSVVEGDLWVDFSGRPGESKLLSALTTRRLGIGTLRNWNTVRSLAEMRGASKGLARSLQTGEEMTIPREYREASRDFDAFMLEVRDRSGLATTNQTYTMVEGVLRVFRWRLTLSEAIAFAQVLPPVLRALFVSDWNLDEPIKTFGTRQEMTSEVKALRRDHNFATDSAIADVATVLRRHVDAAAFERVLDQFPQEARVFWKI